LWSRLSRCWCRFGRSRFDWSGCRGFFCSNVNWNWVNWSRSNWSRSNWCRSNWSRGNWGRGNWGRSNWSRSNWSRGRLGCWLPSYKFISLTLSFRGTLPCLGVKIFVQIVEAFGGVAVEVEPPYAGEDLLVEDGAVGAEERPLAICVTLVPNLTSGFNVGVKASGLAVTSESRLWRHVEDGVISLRLT
jgi:hypothetical protein